MWAIAITVGSATVVSVLVTMLVTRVMFALEDENSRIPEKVVKVFLPLSRIEKRKNILAGISRSIVVVRSASQTCYSAIKRLDEHSPERAALEVEKGQIDMKVADLKVLREQKKLRWALEDHHRNMDRFQKGIK